MLNPNENGWRRHNTIWLMLFVGWVVSYADRTLTGPVVTWMIANKIGFLQAAANPYALGGLIGSLFFAGYMLTQFPGGYFGDHYGHRTIIVISIFWAGFATLLTGLTGGLLTFIALRVFTGLGEGVLYSNDRSFVTKVTPPEKLGLGMGVVMGGLTVGLSAAIVGTVYIINWAKPMLGLNAWKAPFILLGVFTVIAAFFINRFTKERNGKTGEPFGQAFVNIFKYSLVFLAVIMSVYYITNALGLSDVIIAIILTLLAFVLVIFIYINKGAEVGPVLKDRSLILMYISWIACLWHLWFYGFWGGAVVKEFNASSLTSALVVISFNAIAGVIGFPLGGKISDMVAHKANGRRNLLVLMEGVLAVLIFVFAAYIMVATKKSFFIECGILFISGLDFFALQSVGHALVAELAPTEHRGSAFGMFNLVSEIGAVLSPVVSGALRDSTGNWGVPLILDGVIMAAACVLTLGVVSKAAQTFGGNKVQSI